MTLSTRAAALVCSAALLATLPGCEKGSTASATSEAATKALADLPQAAMTSAKDYIAKLGDVNGLLAGIKDQASALKAIPGLAEIVEPLNKLTDSLNALSPEVQNNIRKAFGGQLDAANKAFTSQASRLSANPATGDLLKSTLDKIKLFK
jgi:hypothetical protein